MIWLSHVLLHSDGVGLALCCIQNSGVFVMCVKLELARHLLYLEPENACLARILMVISTISEVVGNNNSELFYKNSC